MSNKKRFFVVNGNLEETAIKLDNKKFLQLPDAGDDPIKILLDAELKHYWFIDQRLFENSIDIISNKDNDVVHEMDPETLNAL